MKFVIEVDDFYLDEEELSEKLQAHITRKVVEQISARIETRVEQAITTRVDALMQKELAQVIDRTLAELLATQTIKVSDKPIQITEHLKNIFEKNHGWNSPHEQMAAIAKKFGEQLKLQYNQIFASKIVMTMKDQGFLKDDMARILLGDKP